MILCDFKFTDTRTAIATERETSGPLSDKDQLYYSCTSTATVAYLLQSSQFTALLRLKTVCPSKEKNALECPSEEKNALECPSKEQ